MEYVLEDLTANLYRFGKELHQSAIIYAVANVFAVDKSQQPKPTMYMRKRAKKRANKRTPLGTVETIAGYTKTTSADDKTIWVPQSAEDLTTDTRRRRSGTSEAETKISPPKG